MRFLIILISTLSLACIRQSSDTQSVNPDLALKIEKKLGIDLVKIYKDASDKRLDELSQIAKTKDEGRFPRVGDLIKRLQEFGKQRVEFHVGSNLKVSRIKHSKKGNVVEIYIDAHITKGQIRDTDDKDAGLKRIPLIGMLKRQLIYAYMLSKHNVYTKRLAAESELFYHKYVKDKDSGKVTINEGVSRAAFEEVLLFVASFDDSMKAFKEADSLTLGKKNTFLNVKDPEINALKIDITEPAKNGIQLPTLRKLKDKILDLKKDGFEITNI